MHCILLDIFYALYTIKFILCIAFYDVELTLKLAGDGPTDRLTDRQTDQQTLSHIELLSHLKIYEVNEYQVERKI